MNTDTVPPDYEHQSKRICCTLWSLCIYALSYSLENISVLWKTLHTVQVPGIMFHDLCDWVRHVFLKVDFVLKKKIWMENNYKHKHSETLYIIFVFQGRNGVTRFSVWNKRLKIDIKHMRFEHKDKQRCVEEKWINQVCIQCFMNKIFYGQFLKWHHFFPYLAHRFGPDGEHHPVAHSPVSVYSYICHDGTILRRYYN